MPTLQAGPLRVHSFGHGQGPAVVLCHGFGAPGNDLVPLGRAIDAGPGVRWFFPEAPLSIEVGYGIEGRAWWNIDMEAIQRAMMTGRPRDFPLDEIPDGMPAARDALDGCIEALVREHGVDPSQLIVGGFSQGGMITTELALHRARPYRGLVILSGSLISAPRWREAMKANGPSLHVLQSHGRQYPLLPFHVAE